MRIQFVSPYDLGLRFNSLTTPREVKCMELTHRRRVGASLQGIPQFAFGGLPVPVIVPSYKCQRPMSSAVCFIQFQCSEGSLLGWWIGFARRQPSKLTKV